MSQLSVSLHGQYYDGRQPLRHRSTLDVGAHEVTLVWDGATQRYPTAELLVSPRVGRTARFIALPDGGQFQCDDDPALDQLPQHSKTEGAVAWLERRIAVAVTGAALIIVLLAGGYEYGLPAAAK